jgi:hypothetical protein
MAAGEPDLFNICVDPTTFIITWMVVCGDCVFFGLAPHILPELGPPLIEGEGMSEGAYNAIGGCVGEFNVVDHAYVVDRVPERT